MPNTTVQAAGEAMPKITRRSILGGMAVMATPAAALAVAPAESPFDLQHWLDTAPANDVVQYHAARLAEAMGTLNASRSWRFKVDHEHSFVLVVGDDIQREASK